MIPVVALYYSVNLEAHSNVVPKLDPNPAEQGSLLSMMTLSELDAENGLDWLV